MLKLHHQKDEVKFILGGESKSSRN